MRNSIIFFLVFLFLLLFYFHKPLFRGEVLLPSECLYAFYPWHFYQDGGRWLLFDMMLQYYPWKLIIHKSLYNGKVPLWNFYNFAGAPLLGNLQSAVFYPINLLLLFLHPAKTFLFSAMMKLFIGFLGTFLLMRQFAANQISSFFAGCIFAFGGFIPLWIGYPHTNVFCFLPWILFFSQRILDRGLKADIAGLIFITLFQLLGGHIEMSFILISATIYFVLVRIWQTRDLSTSNLVKKLHFQPLIKIFLALLIGISLSSLQYLPFMEYMFHSAAMVDREKGVQFDYGLPLKGMITLLYPNYYGNPNKFNYHFGSLTYGEISSGYCGILPQILTLIAIFLLIKRKYFAKSILEKNLPIFQLISLAIIPMIAILLIVYRTPIISHIFHSLPIFKLIFDVRLLALYAFFVSLCAGCGLYLLIQVIKYKRLRMLILSFIVLLSLIDLFLFSYNYVPSSPAREVFPRTQILSQVQLHSPLERASAIGLTFMPNTLSVYGISDIRGYDALTPLYLREFLAYFDPTVHFHNPASNAYFIKLEKFHPRVAELLNIKYLFLPPNVDDSIIDLGSFQKFYQNEVKGYINLKPLKPFFEVDAFEICDDLTTVFHQLADQNFHINEKFLISRQVSKEFLGEISINKRISYYDNNLIGTRFNTNEPQGETQVQWGFNFFTVQAENPQKKWMIVSMNYFPGWVVEIGGKMEKCFPANGILIGCKKKEGQVEYRFSYQPFSYRFGLFLTCISLLFSAFYLIFKPRKPENLLIVNFENEQKEKR